MRLLANSLRCFLIDLPPHYIDWRATSLDLLSDMVLKTMEHCIVQGFKLTPTWVVERPDRVKMMFGINLQAFFALGERGRSGRTFRLSTRSEAGHWRTTSTGTGVEHSVFENTVMHITQDEGLFRQVGRYMVPVFSPIQDEEQRRQWRVRGFLLATYIVLFHAPPLPVSPFFLLAVFMGSSVFQKLTLDDITAFDPEQATLLKPWYNLHPEEPKPSPAPLELTLMLAQLEFHVSFVLVRREGPYSNSDSNRRPA